MHDSASHMIDSNSALADAVSMRTSRVESTSPTKVTVRLAQCAEEVRAAQSLRYQVFFGELDATTDAMGRAEQLDIEPMDAFTDHLIVIDERRSHINLGVVGTYRLLRGDARPAKSPFYSSGEFNIDRLLASRVPLLELGRSCVLREYRQRPVLQLLWKALALYVAEHRVEVMFGCASFPGTDPSAIEDQLAYLHRFHLVVSSLRPYAIGPGAVRSNRLSADIIEPRRVLRRMPPLVRGYLQLGARVGLDAYVDTKFNSIDVCIVLQTADLTTKYARHYQRECDVDLLSPLNRPNA